MNLKKSLIIHFFTILTLMILSGCGGGSGSTSSQQDTSTTAAKASDFSGTWTGFAQTNTTSSMPFTFSVTAANDTTATVAFASSEASGNGTANINSSTNRLEFTFTSVGGNATAYSGTISKMGSTLTLHSLTGGAIASGSGSCTPQSLGSTFDLSGVWAGTSSFTTVGSLNPPTVGGNVTMVLAKDGQDGYVGCLIDSNGDYTGAITVLNGVQTGLPSTTWQYKLMKSNGSTTILNLTGGFDTQTTTFGSDGKVVGGLDLLLSGYTQATGNGVTAQLDLLIQRT